jgi:hypothetical protein
VFFNTCADNPLRVSQLQPVIPHSHHFSESNTFIIIMRIPRGFAQPEVHRSSLQTPKEEGPGATSHGSCWQRARAEVHRPA